MCPRTDSSDFEKSIDDLFELGNLDQDDDDEVDSSNDYEDDYSSTDGE